MSLTAQQIYDAFHSQAEGTQGLATAQQTAQQLAGEYEQHALDTQKLIDTLRTGWTGQAADAASQGLAPAAEYALDRQGHLATTQDLMSRQVESWHTAASQVQPMPPEPQMQHALQAIATGQSVQPLLTQVENYNATAQSNVDAYTEYAAASAYNQHNLPALSDTLPAPGGAPVTAVPPAPTTGPASTMTSPPVPRAPETTGVDAARSMVPGQPMPSGAATPRATSPAAVPGPAPIPGPSTAAPTTASTAEPAPSPTGLGDASVAPIPGQAEPSLVPSSYTPAPSTGADGSPGAFLATPSGPDGATAGPNGGYTSTGEPEPLADPGDGGGRAITGMPDEGGTPREGGPTAGRGGLFADNGPGGRSGAGNNASVAKEERISGTQGAARESEPGAAMAPVGAAGGRPEEDKQRRKKRPGKDKTDPFGILGRLAPAVIGDSAPNEHADTD